MSLEWSGTAYIPRNAGVEYVLDIASPGPIGIVRTAQTD
jgi:hypothetical protein